MRLKKRKIEHISVNRVITSLIVVFTAVPLNAQQTATVSQPKLIVGITIDQLRTDYLQMMFHAFGNKGFKRLMNEGLMYENVSFEIPNVDRSSSTAIIYTGTTPSYNGVVGNTFYNTTKKRVEPILFDASKMGNYTDETLSPKNILTSTICDELKIASDGKSAVFSIAPNSDQAIIGGGHAANAAFWIDNASGKWASSTYYRDIPMYVEEYNISKSLPFQVGSLSWTPLLPASGYTYIPGLSDDFSFKYMFDKPKEGGFVRFKTSGLVNGEVNRLAFTFFNSGILGKGAYPDMLNIGYSATNYQEKTVQECSIEIQDIYLRLDQALGQLLDQIDQKIGLKNCVIFVTSTGYFKCEGREVGSFNIPTGEFYPKRAVSLLNMYLMAVYGQANWVEGYHDRQIFLNRKLIADRLMNIDEIQTKAAEFVIQMTGIQDVITSHQLLHGNWNNRIDDARKGYHRKLSGDLLLEIQPGWDIVSENGSGSRDYVRLNAISSPLFFFGKDIKPERIKREIKATEIAPTVARILRIRSPNAADAKILPELQ